MTASDCIFCKVFDKKISAKIEYEDEEILAFYDINPQAPVHLLMIPKKHIEKMSEMDAKDTPLFGRLIYKAGQIAAQKNWTDYRLIFNNGVEAGQSVFHIHLHLLSGRKMHWPPG